MAAAPLAEMRDQHLRSGVDDLVDLREILGGVDVAAHDQDPRDIGQLSAGRVPQHRQQILRGAAGGRPCR